MVVQEQTFSTLPVGVWVERGYFLCASQLGSSGAACCSLDVGFSAENACSLQRECFSLVIDYTQEFRGIYAYIFQVTKLYPFIPHYPSLLKTLASRHFFCEAKSSRRALFCFSYCRVLSRHISPFLIPLIAQFIIVGVCRCVVLSGC